MGDFCSPSPQQTSQTYTPAPQVMQAYTDIYGRAQSLSQQPTPSYSDAAANSFLSPTQLSGISNINAAQGSATPFFQAATGYGTAGAAPVANLGPGDIYRYMNPYVQSVVNATQANLAQNYTNQLQGITGNATSQGALGGSREAIAKAEALRNFQLGNAPTIANLYSQGYGQAVQTALTQQQNEAANRARQTQAAYLFGNLGPAYQGALLGGANAQLNAGALQQQGWQQSVAFPYQQLSYLAGTTAPYLSALGGTQAGTLTPSTPSPFQLLVGGATAAAAFMPKRHGGRAWARGGRIEDDDINDRIERVEPYHFSPEPPLPSGGGGGGGGGLGGLGAIGSSLGSLFGGVGAAGAGAVGGEAAAAGGGEALAEMAPLALMAIRHGGRVPRMAGGGSLFSTGNLFSGGLSPGQFSVTPYKFSPIKDPTRSSSDDMMKQFAGAGDAASKMYNSSLSPFGSSPSYGGGNVWSGDEYGGSASSPIEGLSAEDYGARGGRMYARGGGVHRHFAHALHALRRAEGGPIDPYDFTLGSDRTFRPGPRTREEPDPEETSPYETAAAGAIRVPTVSYRRPGADDPAYNPDVPFGEGGPYRFDPEAKKAWEVNAPVPTEEGAALAYAEGEGGRRFPTVSEVARARSPYTPEGGVTPPEVVTPESISRPAMRPTVTDTSGPIGWLADKFGVSPSDVRVGLLRAGLGMMMTPGGKGFSGAVAGLAGGAAQGLEALEKSRAQTMGDIRSERNAQIQQQQVNIQRQRLLMDQGKPFSLGFNYAGQEVKGIRDPRYPNDPTKFLVIDPNTGQAVAPGSSPSVSVTEDPLADAVRIKPEDIAARVASYTKNESGAEVPTDPNSPDYQRAMAELEGERANLRNYLFFGNEDKTKAYLRNVVHVPEAAINKEMETVRMIASGQQPVTSQMLSRGPRSFYWQNMQQAARVYDPTGFDPAKGPMRQRAWNDITSGQTAANLRRINTAAGHVQNYYLAGMDLNNEQLKTAGEILDKILPKKMIEMGSLPLNTIEQKINEYRQDPKITRYLLAAAAVAGELDAVFRGSNTAVATIQHWRDALGAPSATKAQVRGAASEIVDLMGSRIDAVQESVNKAFERRPPQFTLVGKHAASVIDALRKPEGLVALNPDGSIRGVKGRVKKVGGKYYEEQPDKTFNEINVPGGE